MKKLVLSIAAVTALMFAAKHTKTTHALYAVAPIGLVAGMKKKGVTLDADEEKTFAAIDETITEHTKGLATTEDLNAAIAKASAGMTAEQLKQFNDTVESVKAQAVVIEQMKAAQPAQAVDNSINGQIKAWLAKEGNKQKFEQFRKGEIRALSLELKSAGTMTIGGSATGAAGYMPVPDIQNGLTDLSRNQPFIAAYMSSSPTSRPDIIWFEKTNPQGNAQFIGEGVLKPLVSFDITKGSSHAKKVADKIKVSTEMLDDIDFMAAEIQNELLYLVNIATDNALLTGDGTGDNLKGITAYAGGYVLTTVSTDTPNNADAIIAALTQIRSLNFNGNMAFVNPIDFANMSLQKGSTGYYVIPPFSSADGMRVGGATVIESNQVPVGHVLVADMSRTNLRPYMPFAIQYGWVNDDFEKNMVTIIGEQRLHHYIKANHTGAFVYDTFANIKSAITAV